MKRGDLYLLRRPGGGDPKNIPKSRLTDFVGSLSPEKLSRLSQALRIALDV